MGKGQGAGGKRIVLLLNNLYLLRAKASHWIFSKCDRYQSLVTLGDFLLQRCDFITKCCKITKIFQLLLCPAEAIADHCGFSRTHFQKIFKQETGMVPSVFIKKTSLTKELCHYDDTAPLFV